MNNATNLVGVPKWHRCSTSRVESFASRNMQPIRTVLRRTGNTSETGVVSSLFPYLPWNTQPSRKVAIDSVTMVRSMASGASEKDTGSVLRMITHVPLLLETFKVFCQKALCSEVSSYLPLVPGKLRIGSEFRINVNGYGREMRSAQNMQVLVSYTDPGNLSMIAHFRARPLSEDGRSCV